MENPLLTMTGLPPFSAIKPEHIEPAVDTVLQENRTLLEKLLAQKEYNWENLVEPLEAMNERLERIWSPVSHLNAVLNSDELRAAYNACLPKLSEYGTELGQNEALFHAISTVAHQEDHDQTQKKILDNNLRDFHLAGVDLPADKKDRFKALMQELSSLSAKFSENLLDATHAWTIHITDEKRLSGLPETAIALARQTAEQKAEDLDISDGWVFTLDFPSYLPVMTYADDRELRHEMYEAYVTRASDTGPDAGLWDNSELMESILRLRHEGAQLLGFENYAERSLATKMAQQPAQVIEFLQDLASRTLPLARKELEEVKSYAVEKHGIQELEPWDVPYYSEKLKQETYNISQEMLRAWFPETSVVPGMFDVVRNLYGINIQEKTDVDTWHPDVRFYQIRDEQENLVGEFYLDLYARPNKRGGAWMAECISRKKSAAGVQTPVAYLTCNFTPPVGDAPSLFTHDEVLTLFHEFGHGLHHLLTRVDYTSVSGINGVAWDAVELPSQFMENWCWQKESIRLLSSHHESGEFLPDELFDRLYDARNFQSAMQMVRQLEFALFDFRIHLEYDTGKGGRIQEILDDVRRQVAVIMPPAYNRFQHGFAHIFAGGYAAGYYSYKWAEVLAADAFSAFEENGIFDQQTGQRFRNTVLAQGGSRDAMELFVEFRGREPKIDALLRHSGLAA